MKNHFSILVVFLAASLILTACAVSFEPTETQSTETLPTDVVVNEPTQALLDGDYIPGHQGDFTGLEVYILESFPVQVNVQVSGDLNDGCVELVDVTAEQTGNTFELTLNTKRPAEEVGCTEALVPFETVVSLDVYGLPMGSYTVIAGDQQAEFRLDVDNSPQEEPISCPEPGEGESAFQAVDREAGVGFCFLMPEEFNETGSEEARIWVFEGPLEATEDIRPALTITLFETGELSFEDWIDMQGEQLKLPQGNFDEQITLYQGIALDVEDWTEQSGARIQWISTGEYVFQLVFSPIAPELYPLATDTIETLYEVVLGSWMVLGE